MTELSVFTRIVNNEIPAAFIYRGPTVSAFMSNAPLRPGHVLVIPNQQVDYWINLDDTLAGEVFNIAKRIGQAVVAAYKSPMAGSVIAGFEVPHTHIHVLPMWSTKDLDFRNTTPANAEELEIEAAKIRTQLVL